jgi:hypothetical protein
MGECDENCGFDCEDFLEGKCPIANELAEEADEEELELYREIYGE